MMMFDKLTVLSLLVLLSVPVAVSHSATFTVSRGSDLQSVIDYTGDGDTIKLAGKNFEARPTHFTDSLCGNCEDPQTDIPGTYGFIVKDKSLVIIGSNRQRSRLVTNAGYGVYIVNSPHTEIRNLTITGGKRDPYEFATNAAIVVRNSRVEVIDVDIRDNNHRSADSAVISGIGGIFGREGAEITIHGCTISDCSWDGVALYRGAAATVTDCRIEDGRGAGIGVTWDAVCFAYRNDISGCWKGIGSFGTSWVVARNNVIHDNLGWGIVGSGHSFMDISNNIVHHNGNCGIAPWGNESRGRIANNIVTENGWREHWVCPCVGVWNNGDWAKWDFSHNIVWNNKDGQYQDIWDQTGRNGNLSLDPMFVDHVNFMLQPGSPGLNAGDSTIYNIDGSRSHIGLHGGSQAPAKR